MRLPNSYRWCLRPEVDVAHYRITWLVVGTFALTACQRSTPARDAVVSIVAREYALQLPDTLPAGPTAFALRNEGTQPHEAAFVRLDSGKTVADVVAADTVPGPDPAWMHWIGGPASFPGGPQSTVTLMLEPGHYAVICGVPGADGKPHFMSGMIRSLTVTPSGPMAAAPTSDIAVRLVDYDFQLATPISAGIHTMAITNGAAQDHHLMMFRLAPGKSIADLLAWLQAAKGPPPLAWASGMTGLSHGNTAYLTVDFIPGTYAMICFLNDDHDNKPHVEHGMQKAFIVQ